MSAGVKKSKSASRSDVFDIGADDNGAAEMEETTGRATGEWVDVTGV